MASLGQLYSNKESELTTKKTFMVPLSKIYAEDGYNVRELNHAHVIEFRDAFIAGEYLPPLAVEVTERGVKVIDGHHRYHGALAAVEMGHEILRLECKDFVGSEADKIAFMVTSSQGLALTPLERGAAYYRLENQGWTTAAIAIKVKRSESDIIQHLQLHKECSPYLQSLVRSGSMNYAIAIGITREHGVYADREAARLMKKAEAAGKTKVTKSIAKPQFNAGKARRLVELLCDAALSNDSGDSLILTDGTAAEIMRILEEYRAGIKDDAVTTATPPEQPAVQPTEQADGASLPLLKTDILSSSGIEVWACAAAAFGDKNEFDFNESKFAHTWAADSLNDPQAVVVPSEIVIAARSLITDHQESEELRTWLASQIDEADNAEVVDEMFERLRTVATETMGNPESPIFEMAGFIALMQNIKSDNWSNIRALRAEVASAVAHLPKEEV